MHKPASDTPLTALASAQVMIDAGVPEDVYDLVTGPGSSLGDALVKNPKVDKIAFTGSTRVGQDMIKTGADTLKDATMELGGKSPHIILADAEINESVQAAFWGIFWNEGEVCMAGSFTGELRCVILNVSAQFFRPRRFFTPATATLVTETCSTARLAT